MDAVEQVVEGVAAESGPGEDPDRTFAAGIAGGGIEGVPRGFQQQALLRVDRRGVARRVAEGGGVEAVQIRQAGVRADEGGVGEQAVVEPGGAQQGGVGLGELRRAVEQDAP